MSAAEIKVRERYFENFTAVSTDGSEDNRQRLKLAEDDPRYDITQNLEQLTIYQLIREQKNIIKLEPDLHSMNLIETEQPVNQRVFKVKKCGDFKLHYRSFLTDETLKPTALESGSNIF